MTREVAIKAIQDFIGWFKEDSLIRKALEMAIQALSQEPCELLIIKSNIFLHQDDRKKWMESIKREKENGVIILPPYFEPLLVPNDIEINMEQEPCDDAISREAVNNLQKYRYNCGDTSITCVSLKSINELPSVTQKSGKWDRSCTCSVCGQWRILESEKNSGKYKFCPNCGARMESEDKE